MACVAKRPLPNFAVEKASLRVFITNGRGHFLEAGKRRLAGDAARAASTGEVTALRREARDLKEVVAEQTSELRLLKKVMGLMAGGRPAAIRCMAI